MAAAYRGGWFDRGAFLGSLLLSSIPYYCLAIVLLYGFAVYLGWLPSGGGYAFVADLADEIVTTLAGVARLHAAAAGRRGHPTPDLHDRAEAKLAEVDRKSTI